MALTDDEKDAGIRNALAEYFECDPSEMGAYVIACEYDVNGQARFSTAWTAIPHWHILGFVEELKNQIKQQRNKAMMESMLMMDGGEES